MTTDSPSKSELQKNITVLSDALRESEEKFKTLTELSPVCTFLDDAQGNVVYINNKCSELIGAPPEKALNLDWIPLIHPDDRERVVDEWTKAFKNSQFFSQEYRWKHSDGKVVWTLGDIVPVPGNDGSATSFIGTLTDITDLKLAEENMHERYEQLKTFIEAIPDAVFLKDGNGRWQMTNQVARALFQIDDYPWQGKTDAELAEERSNFRVAHESCIDSDEFAWKAEKMCIDYEEVTDLNGQSHTFEVRKVPTFKEDKERKTLVIIGRDITQRKLAEEKINTLSHAMEQSPVSIVITNTQGDIEYVNSHFKKVTGYTDKNVIGKNPRILKSGKTPKHIYEELWMSITSGRTWDGEMQNRKKNGEIFWEHGYFSPVIDDLGNIQHFMAIKKDITEQKIAESKLQYQAQYDELTELPNRNLFVDRLQQAIKQSHRSNKQIAVLFIDLDRFKGINDSLGHEFGDALLKQIALALKDTIRETDSIARFGGDEFAVIIDNINDDHMINDTISHITNSISKPFTIDGHQLYITASIGVSLYPHDGETPDILLRNADSAMYQAKDDGRNTYQYYTREMTSKAFEHILMESNLRKALENHEFIVYYQPQVLAEDNSIFGMEALVRWKHPDLGMISPAQFIPLAEETGLIIPLGEEIFDIATKQIVKWMKNSSQQYRMAINLSVKQLQQANIVTQLTEILKTNKCSAEWITLEITEGYVMKNPELAITTLKHFRDIGVDIAIDDFGTGYSSLSYLKRLPINKLKIDQSFVRDLSIDEDDKAIVESIIYLSKAMSLKVIAEGVETLGQKEFLQKHGCSEIQGYLYSKPVTADEMDELLASEVINI